MYWSEIKYGLRRKSQFHDEYDNKQFKQNLYSKRPRGVYESADHRPTFTGCSDHP